MDKPAAPGARAGCAPVSPATEHEDAHEPAAGHAAPVSPACSSGQEVITPEQIEATLRYLVPGFLAVKLFYRFGLQGRRSDLELTLWSVLAAGSINTVLGRFPSLEPDARLLVALVVGGVGGVVLGLGWRALVDRQPQLKAGASRRAWDVVLTVGKRDAAPWVQVWTTDGYVIRGWPRTIGLDADTDAPDLYLRDPAWIDATSNETPPTPMTGVDGVLVAESKIAFVQVMAPQA